MSSVKKLTKKALVDLANDLGISNQLSEKTDLKQDYVDKIEHFIGSNPGASSILSKHLAIAKARSPTKRATPNGAEVTTIDSSDEEVEVEKETEEVGNDSVVSSLTSKFDIKGQFDKIQEKTTEAYDETLEKISDAYYDVTDFIADKSDSLRDFTSSPVTIGAFQSLAEFSYLLYHFLDLTTIGKSKTVPSLIKDNLPKELLKVPTVDYIKLFQHNAITIFTLWSLITVVAPLFISYYVNFTKASKRGAYKYAFDPYIFALTKFLLVLYALKSEVSFSTVKDDVLYNTVGGSCSDAVVAFIFEGVVQTRLLFGGVTLISSGVTAVVALYAVVSK